MQTKQTNTPKQPKKQWIKPKMTLIVIENGTGTILDGGTYSGS